MATLQEWMRAQTEICVDADGTIFDYDSYAKNRFGDLDQKMLKLLQEQKAKGKKITVFTARQKDEWPAMLRYLRKMKVPVDGITNIKPPTCAAFVDDRAVSWVGNINQARKDLARLTERKRT